MLATIPVSQDIVRSPEFQATMPEGMMDDHTLNVEQIEMVVNRFNLEFNQHPLEVGVIVNG